MRTDRRLTVLALIAAAGVVYLIVRGFLADQAATQAREAAGQSEQQAQAAEQTKRYTAQQFLEACRTLDGDAPTELAQACRIAAEVVNAPPPPEDGRDGIGIANVQPGDCSFAVRLTDERLYTIRDLCGRDGADGRGIRSTTVDGCFVRVAYTDDTSERLGPFCGTDGKDGADGEDGQTPPCMSEPNQCRGEDGDKGDKGDTGEKGDKGDRGKPGADGQPPERFTFTDSMGREQTCVRDADSPDTAPTYTCTPNGTR
jgi:hypothetical protein